jgi:hypothetical protein
MDTVTRIKAGFAVGHNQVAKLMTISTRRSATGMFFATSEDEPTFFVSTTSMEALNDAVRVALEELFSSRNHEIVAAIPTDKGDAEKKPWAIIPKEALEDRVPC